VEFFFFLASLGITMAAAAWFTRRLEAICDRLDLSAGVLSILGALGANIPNYVAAIDAIARGSTEIGLGIIIGSNIYNVAITLGMATFVATESKGLRFSLDEARQVKDVGHYALSIMIVTLLLAWLLPQKLFWPALYTLPLTDWFLPIIILLDFSIFVAFAWHILHRPHPVHLIERQREAREPDARLPLLRLIIETLLALSVTLGGVVVMVQSGQDLTNAMHIPSVLAGLLVLAVATSLPNTVVAISLVRTGRAAACAEEIFSSNSVNAALGIALPLLFWRQSTHDPLLLALDAPLMVLLVLWALLSTRRGKISRYTGACLLLTYALWVGVHLFI
jgi:cation:H+ antiporter